MSSPMLKQLSQLSLRVFSPWKGNHIVQGDLSASAVIPWGFVSQQKILESVTPDRLAGGGSVDSGKVEKRAEHLNIDTWEFLRGAEEAYRCTAKLFAQQQQQQQQLQQLQQQPQPQRSTASEASTAAPAHGQAARGSVSSAGPTSVGGGGRDSSGADACGVSNRFAEQESGGGEEAATEGEGAAATDFLEFDVASPQLSMFLNDVLASYRVEGLIPRLSVTTVEAKLCRVGIRLGGISKNTNFMGAMSADEARYNLTMGMLGPEGVVMNELEGRAPQKVIADVRLTCNEEFVLEDGEGRVVHKSESSGPKVHYLTLQSNTGEGTELEWQITNINDVIKPTFNYYFSRFGH